MNKHPMRTLRRRCAVRVIRFIAVRIPLPDGTPVTPEVQARRGACLDLLCISDTIERLPYSR